MLKIVMSKIKYSNFSKLIKLSDSIKSSPTHFADVLYRISLCVSKIFVPFFIILWYRGR